VNSSFALFRHDGLIGATRSLQRDGLIRDAIEWTVTDMEGVPTSRKDADRQLTEMFAQHREIEIISRESDRESEWKRNDLTDENKETSVILASNYIPEHVDVNFVTKEN
ncbi:hypothetical protein ALC57_17291, partial [Trachymyrmex cornetzi]